MSKSRRDFLKTTGAAGLTTSIGTQTALGKQKPGTNTTNWQKTYGDKGFDSIEGVAELKNGYLAGGYKTDTETGNADAWILKTDKQGNKQWEKTIGGQKNDAFLDFIEVNDGYLGIGFTRSFGNKNRDGWIVKVDKQGNEKWRNNHDLSNANDEFVGVSETKDGYALCGYTTKKQQGNYIAWILKTDNQGDEQWNQRYGGEKADFLGDIIETENGYIAVGVTQSFYPDQGTFTDWTLKVNKSGNKLWQKGIGKNGGRYTTIKKTGKNYIIAGTLSNKGTGPTGQGALVLIDSDGNVKWKKKYGLKEASDYFEHVTVLDDGYLASGFTPSYGTGKEDGWLVKTDKQGKVVWQQNHGGRKTDHFTTTIPTRDSYLAVGYSKSKGPGEAGGWLLNFDISSKSIEEVIAGDDGKVQFTELQTAIQYWIQNQLVPGAGKKLTFKKLQNLINLWIQNKKI